MNIPRRLSHLYFMWRVALHLGNALEAEWIQQEAIARVDRAGRE